MNDFITKFLKLKGTLIVTSTNYDVEVYRSFTWVLIKPYTGSTITTTVTGVKTADATGGLGAATLNTGLAAQTFLTAGKAWLRFPGAATSAAKLGTVLIATKDRVTPNNAVNYYVA